MEDEVAGARAGRPMMGMQMNFVLRIPSGGTSAAV
jgi:hypothetical protein